MKPKHHFPVSLDGVEEGDYAMIMGFPGSTDRYLTSYGVQQALDQKNPTIVKIRDKKLAIMRDHMNAKEKVRIQYASKYASTSNYWKYFIGQSKGLKRMKVYEKKKDIEDRFVAWVNEDQKRQEKYGEVLPMIADAFYDNQKINKNRIFLNEAIFQGPEVFYFLYQLEDVIKTCQKMLKKEGLPLMS